jgi:2-dehydro-3-deoxyphosphogluconate aldolase/(4S)-4-hydroxy-2-oxoglutarate aldolase
VTLVQGYEQHDSLLATVTASRLIPVIAIEQARYARALASALLAGGLRCAEVTLRTDAAVDAIAALAQEPDLVVGAGTVLTAEQVDRVRDAGATFVVSPGFGPKVVQRCRELGMPVVPGVMTPTELQRALDAGLRTVKFFPAEQAGGVAMIKALAAPFRDVRFIPTGGIHAGNVADYLKLACVVAVGGSWMVPADALAAQDWHRVERLVAEAVALAAPGNQP